MGKDTELNSLVCRSLDLRVGFQGGSMVKKLCAHDRNTRDVASIPRLGRPPWRKKKFQPTPVILAGKSHGLNSSWGRKELDTTEQLTLSLYLHVHICRLEAVL